MDEAAILETLSAYGFLTAFKPGFHLLLLSGTASERKVDGCIQNHKYRSHNITERCIKLGRVKSYDVR